MLTIEGKAAQNLLNSLIERIELFDEILMASLQTIDNFTALRVIHGVLDA